jgi:hypothetical protein
MYTTSPGATSRTELEAQHVERHAFGGQHPLGAFRRLALAEHQRTDAVRDRETREAVADDHRDHRRSRRGSGDTRADRREDVAGVHARGAHALQARGQHVEQHSESEDGVQVTAVFALDALRRVRARW